MHLNARISRQMPGGLNTETPSPSLSRRQPLLQRSISTPSPSTKCDRATAAELCGNITAECAAVWCCCPCGLVNLLVLAIYKVPARLCRRAIRRRRRQKRLERGLFPSRGSVPGRSECRCGCNGGEFAIHPMGSCSDDDLGGAVEEEAADEAVAALEMEMWNRFYEAGFWRSPSERETSTQSPSGKSHLRSPSPSPVDKIGDRDILAAEISKQL